MPLPAEEPDSVRGSDREAEEAVREIASGKRDGRKEEGWNSS